LVRSRRRNKKAACHDLCWIKGGFLVSIQHGQRQRPRARCSALRTSIVGIGSREKTRLSTPLKVKAFPTDPTQPPLRYCYSAALSRNNAPNQPGLKVGIAQRPGDMALISYHVGQSVWFISLALQRLVHPKVKHKTLAIGFGLKMTLADHEVTASVCAHRAFAI